MIKRFTFREPSSEDGMAIHRLAERCPPLDCNSVYCNLLQASHFQDTAIVAEHDGEICGYVTGYIIPKKPNTLFVWQVAVGSKSRGQGLAQSMLEALLLRQPTVEYLETTVTPDNKPSMRLFRQLAKRIDCSIQEQILFHKHQHFAGEHDDEVLLCIGPFDIFKQTPTSDAEQITQKHTAPTRI